MDLLFFWLIFILPILLLVYFYCRYKLNYWKRRGVQQLRNTDIIFGDYKNGILFRTAPGYHLGDIYRQAPKDAPYIGFYIFHKPCLLLRDPEVIKQILIRDFDNFSDRHFAGSQQKDSVGMKNLFGLKNPAWKYLRSKMTPIFTRSKVKQTLSLMLETGEPMRNYLDKNISCDGSNTIDVQFVSNTFTADLIANVALGTKTDCFNNPCSDYTKSLIDFFHGFKRMVALVTVFYVPELVKLIGSLILFDSTFIHKLFWNAFETREKYDNKRGDLIDSIVRLKNGDQNPIYKFEGDNLLYQTGIFFAGFESSSTAAAFTLMELAKHKKYQELAREDIKNAIEEYGWTYEAFKKMKYLDNCIAESLRLHLPILTIDRSTLQDYKIPGTNIVIEKGTPIFISLNGLHRDPKYFDEPEVYNPNRFAFDKNISPAYLPFGIGPRSCIGSKTGVLQVKVFLSMILTDYEVFLKSKDCKLDSRSSFTAAANGIDVEFKRIIQ